MHRRRLPFGRRRHGEQRATVRVLGDRDLVPEVLDLPERQERDIARKLDLSAVLLDQLRHRGAIDRIGLSASELGGAAVLVFVGSDAIAVDRYLTRIDDTMDRLGADADGFSRLAVLFPGVELPDWRREGWTGLAGQELEVRELARRFGSAQWGGAIPAQSFSVTVIDRRGVTVRRLGGLTTWNEMELLVALDEALDRPDR